MNDGGDAPVALLERAENALLFRRRDADLTGARFLRDVQRLAADLPAAAHVCNLCQDRYHFVVTLAAAALRGQVCLLSSDRSPETLQRLGERFPGVVALTDPAPADVGVLPHRQVRLQNDPVAGVPANPALPAGQLVAVVFTSGSSGLPVGHGKSWGSLAERSRAAGRRFAMTAASPAGVVGTVPAQHMYGFETTVLLPLHAMAASWSGPAFYPADIAAALRAMPAPRVLMTTPLQLRALLEAGTDLPPLDSVISATAPLAPELAAAAERRWHTRVLEIYGATEVGSIASRRTLDGPDWTTYDGIRLEPGEAATQVRITAPHASPFPLADLVEPRSATVFTLLGRNADMVKIGGRRASLAGLNALLTSLPGVVDGVFVVPDDLDRRPGARLLVYVVAPGRAADDILAALRDRVEPVFLPRRVMLVAALPRNETGKLPRAALLGLADPEQGDPGEQGGP